MRDYLILRLQGLMQSWGGHTYEDYRPTGLFPTRSGVVGLLATCMGIDRQDNEKQNALAESFLYAARVDESKYSAQKITDFHTIMDARKVDGKANKNPVISRREYLCDARFTLAFQFHAGALYKLKDIQKAICHPVFTPFLGRRSCPLTHPLYDSIVQAQSLLDALSKIEPKRGTIYSEEEEGSPNRMIVRDVPLGNEKRQFGTRTVFIHA